MGTTTYYPKLGDRTITYSQPKMGKIQLQKDTLKKDSSLGLTSDDDDGIMTLRWKFTSHVSPEPRGSIDDRQPAKIGPGKKDLFQLPRGEWGEIVCVQELWHRIQDEEAAKT
jgi:hypothetical protein